MAETEDPTELISCGKCNTINTVPYGLDKFRCYNCNVMVAISREPSAACAAASTAARHLEEVPVCSIQAAAPATLEQPRRAGEGGASGFLGKLQKTMDKTVQKVVKTIEGLDGSGASGSGTKPLPPRALVGPPSELTAEEEQLQWALDASLREARAQPSAQAMNNGPSRQASPQEAPSAAATVSDPGDQLQAAAAEAARRLRAVEQHARRAEADLAVAKEREASASSARAALERQLQDNERLIQGLTSELDLLHAQLSEKTTRCTALERALVVARNAAAVAAAEAGGQQGSENEIHDLENQGVIAQLLERIAQLESNMLRATHFAPEPADEVGTAEVKKVHDVATMQFSPPSRTSAAEPAATSGTTVEAVTSLVGTSEEAVKAAKADTIADEPAVSAETKAALAAKEGTTAEEQAVPADAKAALAAKEGTAAEEPAEEPAVPADAKALPAAKAESAATEAGPPTQVDEDEEEAVPAANAVLKTEGATASVETEGEAELREEGSTTEVKIREETVAIDKVESVDT